ncbi:trigger factor [Candidatus Parcubacteria bacterium]|nr:MAG: trigger factor [Candidatus Parcubacteria bacterium]
MKIDQSTKEGVASLTLTLPWEEFETIINETTKRLGKDLEVPGFRKGNAPKSAIEEKIGTHKIYQEAALEAVQQNWADLIQRVGDQTIGRPRLNVLKLAPSNELIVKLDFILKPKIKLADYKKIARELLTQRPKEFEVSKEEIQKAIDWLLRSRAKYIAVDRGAKKGDFVEINFSTRLADKELEGGSSQNHPMILGEGRFMKGFEEEIIGLKTGDHKNFSLVAPQNYYRQDLAGKTLDFDVSVRSVQEVLIPELSDEFAKGIGKFESVDGLKENIIQGLKDEKAVKERKDFETKLINEIAEKSEVNLPAALVDEEVEAMVVDMKNEVLQAKLDFSQYLEQINQTEEILKKSLRPKAERNLKAALVLQGIAEKENIEVSQEEIDASFNNYLGRFKSIKQAKQEVDLSALKTYTENTLRNQKTLNFLEKIN